MGSGQKHDHRQINTIFEELEVGDGEKLESVSSKRETDKFLMIEGELLVVNGVKKAEEVSVGVGDVEGKINLLIENKSTCVSSSSKSYSKYSVLKLLIEDCFWYIFLFS